MSKKLTVGSCFSGIGGMEKGLEDTGGFETKWQIEIDNYATMVLEKHWPHVKRYSDITEIECLKKQMLSSEVFPAKISALAEKEPELPAPVLAYGNGFYAPFAWYDQDSQLWKTFQRSLEGGWEPYSETWPKRGMTRNGIAFQLVKSERHIHGKGCSLWPTPCATELKGGGYSVEKAKRNGHQIHLRTKLGGRPNPTWTEWLMGFPAKWTELDASAIQLFRKLRRKSGE